MLLTQDYPPAIGGIQTWASALSRALAPLCEAFCVVAPDQPGAAQYDRQSGLPTERIKTSSDLMRLVALPGLRRAAKQHRINTVLTGHWYVAAAALISRRMGLVERVYPAAHAQELLKEAVPGPCRPAYRAHRRRVLRAANGCFPVSRFTQGLLEADGVAPELITVAPNGTDVERFDQDAARASGARLRAELGLGTAPVLATIARLVPRKGVDTVLQALPAIRRAHPDVRYLICGDGPDGERLKRLAGELDVLDACVFTGRVTDEQVPAAFHASTVFVMPARQIGPSVEGFGLVFREANACSKPVIGASSGGVPDAISHQETGLLVPPEDPAAVAAAAIRLLSDRELARRLGETGLHVTRTTGTWEHTAQTIVARLEADRAQQNDTLEAP